MAKNKVYSELEAKLKELEELPFQELHYRYQKAFGRRSLSKDRDSLLRPLSYKLQEKMLGGLSQTTYNKLHRFAFECQLKIQDKFHMQPGTNLVREWNGNKYHVVIRGNGVEWNGKIYKSLTAVARTITGAPWSGPLFFGIRPEHKRSTK